jgi:hypothetical protein
MEKGLRPFKGSYAEAIDCSPDPKHSIKVCITSSTHFLQQTFG